MDIEKLRDAKEIRHTGSLCNEKGPKVLAWGLLAIKVADALLSARTAWTTAYLDRHLTHGGGCTLDCLDKEGLAH